MNHPVTAYQQRRLDWLDSAHRVGWTGPVNLTHRAYLAEGHIDLAALRLACRHTALRHEALRTTFNPEPDGTWTASTVKNPPTAVQLHSPSHTTDPEHLATGLIARHEPFGPNDTPRFRLHVAPLTPNQAVLVLTADRLVTDDRSLAILTRTISDIYKTTLHHVTAPPEPDQNWQRRTAAAAEIAAPALPSDWTSLGNHMAAHGAHAGVALPVKLPLDEHPDPLDTSTLAVELDTNGLGTAAARAGIEPFAVQLAAVAEPITDLTNEPAWLYLYPDLRQPHEHNTIGPYTARTLIHIPPRHRPAGEQLHDIQQRFNQARGPGVAWTEHLHAHAGANQTPPRDPSIAVTATPQPAHLSLFGTQIIPLPTTTLDLGPGRIAYELTDRSLHIHHERGRYPDTLLATLGREGARALAEFAARLPGWSRAK